MPTARERNVLRLIASQGKSQKSFDFTEYNALISRLKLLRGCVSGSFEKLLYADPDSFIFNELYQYFKKLPEKLNHLIQSCLPTLYKTNRLYWAMERRPLLHEILCKETKELASRFYKIKKKHRAMYGMARSRDPNRQEIIFENFENLLDEFLALLTVIYPRPTQQGQQKMGYLPQLLFFIECNGAREENKIWHLSVFLREFGVDLVQCYCSETVRLFLEVFSDSAQEIEAYVNVSKPRFNEPSIKPLLTLITNITSSLENHHEEPIVKNFLQPAVEALSEAIECYNEGSTDFYLLARQCHQLTESGFREQVELKFNQSGTLDEQEIALRYLYELIKQSVTSESCEAINPAMEKLGLQYLLACNRGLPVQMQYGLEYRNGQWGIQPPAAVPMDVAESKEIPRPVSDDGAITQGGFVSLGVSTFEEGDGWSTSGLDEASGGPTPMRASGPGSSSLPPSRTRSALNTFWDIGAQSLFSSARWKRAREEKEEKEEKKAQSGFQRASKRQKRFLPR